MGAGALLALTGGLAAPAIAAGLGAAVTAVGGTAVTATAVAGMNRCGRWVAHCRHSDSGVCHMCVSCFPVLPCSPPCCKGAPIWRVEGVSLHAMMFFESKRWTFWWEIPHSRYTHQIPLSPPSPPQAPPARQRALRPSPQVSELMEPLRLVTGPTPRWPLRFKVGQG